MKTLTQFIIEKNLTQSKVKNLLKKEKCHKVIKHKIHLDGECEKKIITNISNKNKMDFNILKNMDEEFAYLLGFMWSDGFISKDKNYVVSISIVEDDYKNVEKIFDKHILWTKRKIIYLNKKWKTQIRSYVYNKDLHNFFTSLGYQNKSFNDFTLIKNFLPKNLIKYFLRGVIDGDGCFYVKYGTKKYQKFVITNNSNYDWSSFCDILSEIGVHNYHLSCRFNGKSKNSSLTINSLSEILKLGDFIYDKTFDGIGLERKFVKFSQMR